MERFILAVLLLSLNIIILIIISSCLTWGDQPRSPSLTDQLSTGSNTNQVIHPATALDPQSIFDKLNSPEIEITNDNVSSGIFPIWVPSGGGKDPLFKWSCKDVNEDIFLNKFIQGSGNAADYQFLKKRCFTPDAKGELSTSIVVRTIDYPIGQHPWTRPVKINLDDGTILRGLLALNPGANIKRPLIVIQCGYVCRLDRISPEVLPAIVHSYDEGPYHILLVVSSTGAQYITDNERIEIGGPFEGVSLIKLAQTLQSAKSKFHDYISSVHLLGVSLGGQASLYASIFNKSPRLKEKHHYKSIVALCPAINFEKSTDSVFSNFITRWFFRRRAWKQVTDAAHFVPRIAKIADRSYVPEKLAFRDMMVNLAVEHLPLRFTGNNRMLPPINNQLLTLCFIDNLLLFTKSYLSSSYSIFILFYLRINHLIYPR